MTKPNKEYTDSDIEVLTDAQHVRKRLGMYAGSNTATTFKYPLFKGNKIDFVDITFVPATYKALGEILDNSIDELTQINIKDKTISLIADPDAGDYTVSDNGRGVPIGMHASGKHTPEVVFASLRSGRNFSDNREAGVIGMNGIGSSFVAMSSTAFNIDITRDGKNYKQSLLQGIDVIQPPVITKAKVPGTGTSIQFQLDPKVYSNISLPYDLVRNRAQEIAICNPGFKVEFNGEDFQFAKGLEGVLKGVSKQHMKIAGPIGDIYVCFDLHNGIDEQMFTWVNSSLLFDGGICNTQFMNAFVDKVVEHLKPQAKKQKCEVTKNDIKKDLLVFGVLKIANPQYDAQNKTRLVGPSMKKEFVDMVEAAWKMFARTNKEWLELVLERASRRHHGKANDAAAKQHLSSIKKKVPGLLDATGKDRMKCQLLITEGDSASAQISEVRDPTTTATLPLTGKINNVYGCTVAEVLGMGKISDLLAAIGLVPGRKAIRSELNYGQIVISSDADVDGGNIFTLLVNLFYQYWPELMDPSQPPIIMRLAAPNVVASKGKRRVHFSTRDEFEKKKDSLTGYTIEYCKGLGSLAKEDWEMILDPDNKKCKIAIVDDGGVADILKLLFSDNSDGRKEWLQAK